MLLGSVFNFRVLCQVLCNTNGHQSEPTSAATVTMLAATRRWFRRNRTPIAIGVGVVGAGYVATNYVLGKLRDARERMSSDRIAKEKSVQKTGPPSTIEAC